MEVEVEGEDGTKFVLGTRGEILFGRGSGFNTDDRTVSRRHISFLLRSSLEKSDVGGEPRVSFEVIGRNPIWVFGKNYGEIRIFRKFEKGEMEIGDRFCLSGKAPVWFDLRDCKVQEGKMTVSGIEKEVSESSSNGPDLEDIDVSGIDPVKEFGFVAMGHDFEHYPKGMIMNMKNWSWFLEEPNKDDEDEDDDFEERKRSTIRGKRKKGKYERDEEDDDWTAETEEETDLVASMRKVGRSGYSTRSRDRNKQIKESKGSKNSGRKKAPSVDEIEDGEDETLGGFIVDDEEEDKEEENSEEEEEFEEDEVED